MIAQMDFAFPNADIGTVKFTYDIGDITSATAYAAPSYPATPSLYHFGNWSISTGALTAPTTTALAAMATPIATSATRRCRSTTTCAPTGSTAAAPAARASRCRGCVTSAARHRRVRLDDLPGCGAQRHADGLLFQYTGAALSTGVETIQLVLPEVKFDKELRRPTAPT
jgi:hypothetical protein